MKAGHLVLEKCMMNRMPFSLQILFLGCVCWLSANCSLVAGQDDHTDRLAADSAGPVPIQADQETADTDKQTEDTPSGAIGVTFSNPVDNKWKVGVRIIGASKVARNMLVTIPVPSDWPEQQVVTASEEIPANVDEVQFRDLESGVRQLVLTVPVVRRGKRQS